MPKGKKVIGYPKEVRDGRGVPQREPWDRRIDPDTWFPLVVERRTGEIDWDARLTAVEVSERYGDPIGPITVVVPSEGLADEVARKGKCPGYCSQVESNRALLFCPHCSCSVHLSGKIAAPLSVWDITQKHGGPKPREIIRVMIPTMGLDNGFAQGGRCCACAADLWSNRKLVFCPHCGSEVGLS
jgi:hypothetical protein